MKHRTTVGAIICIVAVLSACKPSSAQLTPVASVSTVTSQPTVFLSPTPDITATATVVAKSTALPPTNTFTPEPVGTLTESEEQLAEAEIKELFQNPAVCRIPCYLGVIPGQTTTTELRDIFAKWGIALQFSPEDTSAFYINQQFKSGYTLNATFLMKADVVESIGFDVNQNEPVEWAVYSPAALLTYYGAPSQVSFWIGSIHEPSPTPWKGWYYMSMSYDERDLYIAYADVEIRLDEKVVACPQTDAYGSAKVWLGKYPDFMPPPHVTDIEEAAAMTEQKFHDYVLLGPGACFYLDLSKIAFL